MNTGVRVHNFINGSINSSDDRLYVQQYMGNYYVHRNLYDTWYTRQWSFYITRYQVYEYRHSTEYGNYSRLAMQSRSIELDKKAVRANMVFIQGSPTRRAWVSGARTNCKSAQHLTEEANSIRSTYIIIPKR